MKWAENPPKIHKNLSILDHEGGKIEQNERKKEK